VNGFFCHYDPGKEKYSKKRFVQNKEWKLYENGDIYHVKSDPLEKTRIEENDLNTELKTTYLDVSGSI